MTLRICILINLINVTLSVSIKAQSDCVTSVGSIYGSPSGNERGYSLAATPENDGFYLAGLKEDSVLILKVDLAGGVQWARTFDIVPEDEYHVNAIIVDSDGMLALAGTAGDLNVEASVFVFRYNPNSNKVLWANEYFSTPRSFNFSMIQKGAGGNYILSNNHFEVDISNNDSELLEINKNTGAVIPASL